MVVCNVNEYVRHNSCCFYRDAYFVRVNGSKCLCVFVGYMSSVKAGFRVVLELQARVNLPNPSKVNSAVRVRIWSVHSALEPS